MEYIDKLVSLLPEMKRCTNLSIERESIFIAAGGFEDRAFASAKQSDNSSVRQALLLNYSPEDKRNRFNEVKSMFQSKGFIVDVNDVIEFDRYDPEQFSNKLQRRLKELHASKVVLDVSAMSKLALLLCLMTCCEMNLDTTIFYAEAEEKGPTKDEYDEARRKKDLHQPSIQVYTGIHGVIRVTGLSSVAMQGQPSAALAFMSFNESLTQALLNAVYPSRLFLINGKSPNWNWREEATAWIHEQLRTEWPDEDNPLAPPLETGVRLPSRVISLIDYRDTVRILLKLYWNLSVDHRILLAPTGSKMQTLGCFFAKALHPDIHVEYPTPAGFLPTYSSGVGPAWLIGFGPLGDKVSSLRREERKALLGVSVDY